jgi:hypothetical protein
MVAVALGFLRFCLGVMTVKLSSSSITSRDGCSAGAPADDAGFYASCLVAVVPPWEQCTSAVTVMFWLTEGHATGETDLGVCGTGSLSLSVGGVLLAAHIEPSSASEFSGEELSGSTLCGNRRLCLRCLVSLVGLLVCPSQICVLWPFWISTRLHVELSAHRHP